MKYVNKRCAICGTFDNSIEVFQENLDNSSATPEIFSARRVPDRRFYRWVRCKTCNLFRSDPVLDVNLDELYMKSTFDYGNEVQGLKKTYRRLVQMALKPDSPRGHILEVGGATGFSLKKL